VRPGTRACAARTSHPVIPITSSRPDPIAYGKVRFTRFSYAGREAGDVVWVSIEHDDDG
jgi:hypothetical protein